MKGFADFHELLWMDMLSCFHWRLFALIGGLTDFRLWIAVRFRALVDELGCSPCCPVSPVVKKWFRVSGSEFGVPGSQSVFIRVNPWFRRIGFWFTVEDIRGIRSIRFIRVPRA